MPYATRQMVRFMKESGISKIEEAPPSGGGSQSRKIRELPSSVDPENESVVEAVPSKKKSAGGGGSATSVASHKGSKKSKSDSTGSKGGKPKSAEACGSKTGKPKSASSHIHSKAASSSNTKLKKSSSAIGKPKSHDNNTRVVNASTMALAPVSGTGHAMSQDEKMTFDQKKVRFLHEMLRSNVHRLKELTASDPYESAQKQYNMYSIEEKKSFAERKAHSAKAMFECTHKSFPKECRVVAKVYDAKGAYDAHKSLYLKVLRHLGKKHPNIIQTWDVIAKDGSIYVFQELAPFGNMVDHMSKYGALPEKQAHEAAKQMRTAVDFLGDMGIAHRDICPRHILLLHKEKEFRIKLTGFRQAIVYYNPQKDDINYQVCIPLEKKPKAEDYHAPEIYGNPEKEEYDPVAADVFSLGATIYHLLTAKHPFDCSKNNPKIEHEIRSNIRALKVSERAKSALGHMLTTHSTRRFSVERLHEHAWFVETA